jgi:hypothetical protein
MNRSSKIVKAARETVFLFGVVVIVVGTAFVLEYEPLYEGPNLGSAPLLLMGLLTTSVIFCCATRETRAKPKQNHHAKPESPIESPPETRQEPYRPPSIETPAPCPVARTTTPGASCMAHRVWRGAPPAAVLADPAASVRKMTCVVRSIFKDWAAEFLREHPRGTVVEVGARGSRLFEELDNGNARWIQIVPPGSPADSQPCTDGQHRFTVIESPLEDSDWIDQVQWHSRGEAALLLIPQVLACLEEKQARELLTKLAERLPGSIVAFDTVSPQVAGADSDGAGDATCSSFRWGIRDPRQIESWVSRSLVEESITPIELRLRRSLRQYFDQLPNDVQALALLPGLWRSHSINRLRLSGVVGLRPSEEPAVSESMASHPSGAWSSTPPLRPAAPAQSRLAVSPTASGLGYWCLERPGPSTGAPSGPELFWTACLPLTLKTSVGRRVSNAGLHGRSRPKSLDMREEPDVLAGCAGSREPA